MFNIKYLKVNIYGIFFNDQNFENVLLTLPNLVYFCIIHNNENNRLIDSE